MKLGRILAVGALPLAAYVALPFHATRALGDALRSGEPPRLERWIDFASLRSALRRDLDARGRAMLGDGPLLNQLADMFGDTLLDGAVDVYVTPQGLATLIETGDLAKAALAGVVRPDAARDFRIELRDASWAFFSSPTTFRVELANATLVLRLQGAGWKLVDVVPKRSGEPAAPAPAALEPAAQAGP